MPATMHHADVLAWAATYTGPKYHAALLDPPYELGFMGRAWDRSGIAFRPEMWATLSQHLHPGAFVFAFAGTRGYHRMACAIEDAGLIIHPALGWSFGSGFPKATNLSKAIDKRAGAERQKVMVPTKRANRPEQAGPIALGATGFADISEPITDLARQWAGHRYGGQVLKPAFEFICVAQVPYAGQPIDSITATGAGALNIDGARIGRAAGDRFAYGVDGDEVGNANQVYGKLGAAAYEPHSAGRWPANLLLSHVALPVTRLRDNVPREVAYLITEYFNGYFRVQAMRERAGSSTITSATQEVLQRSVCERGKARAEGAAGADTVPVLQADIPMPASMGKERAAEVLQHPLQESPLLNTESGEESEVWQAVDRSIETEDRGESSGAPTGTSRAETCCMEGWIVPVSWLSDGDGRSVERSGSSAGCAYDEQVGLCDGTPSCHGSATCTPTHEARDCSPSERRQDRQPSGESRGTGNGSALAHTSGHGTRDSTLEVRERTLEVFACDLPAGWMRYFELTGEDLGCCNGACVADCAVAALGRQSGESNKPSKGVRGRGSEIYANGKGFANTLAEVGQDVGYGDTGTAARYFHQSDWMLERLELQDSLIYSPKAARAEREAGLDPLQTALMRQIYGIEEDFDETTVDDGREKSIDNPYLRGETTRRNVHPTLKPISLCRHLATLLLPPDAYAPRRLLVPFAGAASEMVGALLAGWEEIDGVELDETHCRIARARLAYWQQQRYKFDQGQPITIKSAPTTNQPTLFDE